MKTSELFKMKFLLFMICVSFLLCQSIGLLNEFMSGKTVTTISYGIIRNTTLPAITLCPNNLDFRKLAMSNENVLLYEKFMKKIKNATRSDINDMGINLIDTYLDALEIFFNLKTPNININEKILENLPPFINQMNETLLNVKFRLSTVYGNSSNDIMGIDNHSHRMISLPMESLKIYLLDNYPFVKKCYTLFSHSHSLWNNINIDFKGFIIILKLDPHSISIVPRISIPIRMHSPNDLPFENYNYIRAGYHYIVVTLTRAHL